MRMVQFFGEFFFMCGIRLKGVSNDEQEENAKPLMKKRGRPRKRKPLPVKNQSELAGSSAESHRWVLQC